MNALMVTKKPQDVKPWGGALGEVVRWVVEAADVFLPANADVERRLDWEKGKWEKGKRCQAYARHYVM